MYSVAYTTKSYVFCYGLVFPVPCTMLFADAFSIATGVGGCEWPISARKNMWKIFCRILSRTQQNLMSFAMDWFFLFQFAGVLSFLCLLLLVSNILVSYLCGTILGGPS